MGQRLVLHKPMLARRSNGLLVQTHRFNIAAFNAGDLRAHQGGAVLKIVRAVLRPHRELLVVGGQRLQMLRPLVGRCSFILSRSREGIIEMVFGHLKE